MWLLRVAPPYFYNRRASMFKPPCNAKPLIINVRFGSCVDGSLLARIVLTLMQSGRVQSVRRCRVAL